MTFQTKEKECSTTTKLNVLCNACYRIVCGLTSHRMSIFWRSGWTFRRILSSVNSNRMCRCVDWASWHARSPATSQSAGIVLISPLSSTTQHGRKERRRKYYEKYYTQTWDTSIFMKAAYSMASLKPACWNLYAAQQGLATVTFQRKSMPHLLRRLRSMSWGG